MRHCSSAPARLILDENLQDIDYIKQFTDMPLRPYGYAAVSGSARCGQGFQVPGFLEELGPHSNPLPDQIERLGGMMVWDLNKKQAVPLHREQGLSLRAKGIDPALNGTYRVKLLNGREVDVSPIYQMYQVHLQDYDLDTVAQITRAPKDLIVRWGRDSGTIKPAAMHNGEGVCHYFT